ncbi:serine-threonine/tyrosine-protein kinase catalytic domain-containing protein [Artemisia annua]|uniref:Serine-threonine/tyrosine-protein kinase catalytic domain-containing protein n=1 Tax=Artemisia annua TaxID=35608 RepID=A0A2U1M7I5_ARTAN|nr:serine-threonine/tyrosine-protein kinase catalytic domain-containing protein [Artemisia annua]
MSVLKGSQHLRLSLKEVELATKNFSEPIGKGGYGMVYKGELPISGRPTTVAVKRLNETSGQGLKEFLTEIQLLSDQNHKNVVSLLGYCDEGKEKSLIYEYAANGSLDVHIKNRDTSLNWRKRLEICLDAARGLNHLHSNSKNKQTIIHRDIKSANILLDQNWVAKIADLGLSKLNFESSEGSSIVSNACGTPGYCDPGYYNGILKKECDVYSFGIVLFEVLCGKLCSPYPNKDSGFFFLSGPSVQKYYKENKMKEIIDPCLKEQMSSYSISKFSEVAYKCLLKDERKRPSMNRKEIELASLNENGSSGSNSHALDPISELRYEKAKRIFQRFDVDRDGVLNAKELSKFVVVTNPQVKYTESQICNETDKLFDLYGHFTNGEKGLTCDGMLRAYEHGVDNLNTHFELLRLDIISPFDDKGDSFRTTERNKDGCLNEEELFLFLAIVKSPQDVEEHKENIDNIVFLYGEVFEGEKGLNCDGLFRVYGYGIDSLDVDFEKLCLNLKPLDETETTLRYEKARRIFQRFDINGDGGLNREEVTEFLLTMLPELRTNDETISHLVDCMFDFLSEYTDGEKGITCDGLFHNYEDGIGGLLDSDFELLGLDLKHLDDGQIASRRRERYEKVKTIFHQYDLNRDGGLNTYELVIFFGFKHPDIVDYPEELIGYVVKVSRWYAEYIDGEKGLTCDGLLRTYDHGIDSLDADFERLGIDTTLTEKEATSRARDRSEKVRKIFKRFDFDGDGVLNREETTSYIVALSPGLDDHMHAILADPMLQLYGDQSIDGVTGLYFDGLLKMYDSGADHLDDDFKLLNLR